MEVEMRYDLGHGESFGVEMEEAADTVRIWTHSEDHMVELDAEQLDVLVDALQRAAGLIVRYDVIGDPISDHSVQGDR